MTSEVFQVKQQLILLHIFKQSTSQFFNVYILEVGNLGDTEAADNADFNALEVPPGGLAESPPSHPDSLVS